MDPSLGLMKPTFNWALASQSPNARASSGFLGMTLVVVIHQSLVPFKEPRRRRCVGPSEPHA